MSKRNFLLGYGERLTENVQPSGKRMDKKKMPYPIDEARDFLAPLVADVADITAELPPEACPDDRAVSVVTLHPQFIAKSYFPSGLFREVGLDPVGSRIKKVTPRKWTRKGDPAPIETTEIFVSAPRGVYRNWADSLPSWAEDVSVASDLQKIEQISLDSLDHKLRLIKSSKQHLYLEIVLHASGHTPYIIDSFRKYLEFLDIEYDLNRRIYAGRLCFVPLRVQATKVRDLAKFSFLRVAREMPKLRAFAPIRSFSIPNPPNVELPAEAPINPDLRAAVFDGGMSNAPELGKWSTRHESGDISDSVPEGLHHGSCVTSAVLFGPIAPGQQIERPFAHVDHYRVLDTESGADIDLYDVLPRIRDVLQSGRYKFANLSIGPELPITDDEVHPWTAVLDEVLSSGDILTTVAAGNNGEGDAQLNYNRVQVPSDCVNALAVGSANSLTSDWSRATYSAVGPGRSPGLIKPDVLAFGGAQGSPYWVVDPDDPSKLYPQAGTSFAAPSALRLALGVRAHFGESLNPLAIKALLVHCAEESGLEKSEQGWGRVPGAIEDIVVCPNGAARIVYQGELLPAQHLRAQIPLPEQQLNGDVVITATISYATAVDPEDPCSYTRSGLDIVFRPHEDKFDTVKGDDGTLVSSTHPKTDSFFQLKNYSLEKELRKDAHKWETVLHRRRTKRGSSLQNPVFDIHFAPRAYGAIAPAHMTDKIRYALVITVENKHTPDLYNQIAQRYRTQLQPLVPVVQVPIRT
jgi:hypothetical protein